MADHDPTPDEHLWPPRALRWLSRPQLRGVLSLASIPAQRAEVGMHTNVRRVLLRRGIIAMERMWAVRPHEVPALTDAGRAVAAAFEAGRAREKGRTRRLLAENNSLREQLANLTTERDALAEHLESVTDPDGMPLGPGVDSSSEQRAWTGAEILEQARKNAHLFTSEDFDRMAAAVAEHREPEVDS